MSQASLPVEGGVTRVHAARLFAASCMGLTSGAVMFAITGDIMGTLKQAFILNNEQVGWVMSGGSWGFMLSMIGLGPLCDWLGMKLLMRLAVLCHAAGILMMIFANGFVMLFMGVLVNAVGSGAIEAACNPLIATIYPDKKTHKLNQFHMWFPGGIVIGGLICYAMDALGASQWQWKVAVGLVPTAAYAVMFIGQIFPATERVQSGISFGGMVKETFLRPLFLVLLVCMMLTASLELGPNRWIPAVLQSGGIPGILVLVWITGLMAVLRLSAGPVTRAISNSAMLLWSSIIAGVGLMMLSLGGSIYFIGAAATIFAVGVCYFWPTMLGTVAERVPKGGALALAVIGGLGSLFVGTVTTPLMGKIADTYLHRELVSRGTVNGAEVDHAKETAGVLQDVDRTYEAWEKTLGNSKAEAITRAEITEARVAVIKALAPWEAKGILPEGDTAAALRSASKNGPPDKAAGDAAGAALAAKKAAEAVLNPADNAGGLISFRYVAVLSVVLVAVFGVMYVQDRRRAVGRA